MASVRPVALRLVRPEWSAEVPSPTHDALSAEARRRHLVEHPLSYLGVTRSPDDVDLAAALPGETDPADVAARLSRTSLEDLLREGAFAPERPPGIYVYRLRQGDPRHGGHVQTGLVCGVATADYDNGVVRIHEQINERRADLLARHLSAVGAQSSPIAMAFRAAAEVERIMERATAAEPLLDITDGDLGHALWPLTDQADIAVAMAALASEPLYLIDGHHRAAAASSDRRTRAAAGADGETVEAIGEGEHSMLSVLFPAGQLRNEAFHRVLDGVQADDLLARMAERFPVRPAESLAEVVGRSDGLVAVAVAGEDPNPMWSLVELPPPAPIDGHVLDIDPIRLGQHVLAPLLGIEEPTHDPRLTYRPGPADAEAAAALRLRPGQIEFWMRPVPLEVLLGMADRGHIMPPKSTYFEPKARAGLFVRITDPSLADR